MLSAIRAMHLQILFFGREILFEGVEILFEWVGLQKLQKLQIQKMANRLQKILVYCCSPRGDAPANSLPWTEISIYLEIRINHSFSS